ncbi:hypothetical protein [Halostagnicola kamekurae]|uniref:hypothetical protein n=1 Tax=Halostagnicola kamekurae TaxID=619731 RepID=UPI000B809383|nr:hypothetical protein [Halostagnicola kamekurae]
MPVGTATAQPEKVQAAQNDQATNESIAPGAQLTGVLGVQNAEVNGAVTERAYGIKIANAQTADAEAAVIGEQFEDIDDRLEDLEDRRDELEDERDTGNISEGEYRAEIATIRAEQATAERLAADAESNASELPADLLEEQGVNASAIQELSERADELTGPETAEIAQSIAGNSAGSPVAGDNGPADVPAGPPVDTESNRTEASVPAAENTPRERGNASAGDSSSERPIDGDSTSESEPKADEGDESEPEASTSKPEPKADEGDESETDHGSESDTSNRDDGNSRPAFA